MPSRRSVFGLETKMNSFTNNKTLIFYPSCKPPHLSLKPTTHEVFARTAPTMLDATVLRICAPVASNVFGNLKSLKGFFCCLSLSFPLFRETNT